MAIGVAVSSASVSSSERAVVRLDRTTISASQIDATVTRWMRSARVTGAGIALLNDRNVVYMKAYGVRDAARNLPLTVDSVMTSKDSSNKQMRYESALAGSQVG